MREKESTTQVIYVRHGKTDFPIDRIYCDDREDPPLNGAGLVQAQAAAQLLRAHDVDAIFASPSRRTRMTADAIAQVAKAPIIENADLRERRFGIWDGLYFDEIASDYPDAYQSWKHDPVHYTPEGGETIDELLGRVITSVERAIESNLGKTIVVVSHVGPIRVSLAHALKIPVKWYRQLRVDYGAITRVDYGASQNNLAFFNLSRLFIDH